MWNLKTYPWVQVHCSSFGIHSTVYMYAVDNVISEWVIYSSISNTAEKFVQPVVPFSVGVCWTAGQNTSLLRGWKKVFGQIKITVNMLCWQMTDSAIEWYNILFTIKKSWGWFGSIFSVIRHLHCEAPSYQFCSIWLNVNKVLTSIPQKSSCYFC